MPLNRLPFYPTRRFRRLLIAALLLAAVAAGVAYWPGGEPENQGEFVTAKVTRGNLRQTVNANGTLNPVNTVTVGTQITGPILKLHADYNDAVKKGQLLAEIDPTLQQAQIDQTRAQLLTATSSLELSIRNAARLKRLYDAGYIALAEVERANQEVISSRANTQSLKAQLERDQKNLDYAMVRSPIDGVVIARTVSEGQTLQANFQTPELYKIAEDLTNMQIDMKLSEVDIGMVKEGQPVMFAVDAYPDRRYEGALTHLRLNPENQQGSVTYTGIVKVENPDKSLLPGMTAYVSIISAEKQDVLYLPNAALRFIPIEQGKDRRRQPQEPLSSPDARRVWVLKQGAPQPVEITTGMTDERYTEILTGPLAEGDEVIIRQMLPGDDVL